MKNEIKEILTEMINLNDYEDYKIYGKRANEIGKLLLDYINNLQEQYEKADNDRHKLFEQKEKAIEYIEKCRYYHEGVHKQYEYVMYPDEIVKLLNILQGEDNEII